MNSSLAGLNIAPLPIAAPAAGVGVGITEHIFPDFMQTQLQKKWCWSAVGTSVGLLFQTGNWTQCDTANHCLSFTDCCNQPTPSACNEAWNLESSLTYTESFNTSFHGTYSPTDIQTQVNSARPVLAKGAGS
jgi:hypothetical protein